MSRKIIKKSLLLSMVFICLLCNFVPNHAIGQAIRNNDISYYTQPIDTARLLSDQPVKSPWQALARSAILPGWGQVYNEKYLKGAAVFGVNAFLISRIVHYNRKWRTTGVEDFRNKRNLFTWYSGIAYLLTLMDAYVDAYLFGFDEAMKISFSPLNLYHKENVAWGLSIQISH